MLVKTVTFLCILLLFVTCKKAENNPNAECLLTKISVSNNDNTITIEYDANNNPSAIRTCYNRDETGCYCNYPKYRNNRLYEAQVEGFCGKPEYTWMRYYSVNDKGQIVGQYSKSKALSDTTCFLAREYNDQGKLAEFYQSCRDSATGYMISFNYLPNENIKEILRNDRDFMAFDFQAYDDKKSILNDNPAWMVITFESQFFMFLKHLGWGGGYAYSPNNPTRYRFYDEGGYVTADLKYEYNLQGYPIKCEVSELLEDTNFTRKRVVFFEYKFK